MEIGKDVKESLKVKVFEIFARNAGNDAVFPTKNGSPKILTKFVNHPYSYELLPEYERGERKLPNTKAMNWEGKTYSAHRHTGLHQRHLSGGKVPTSKEYI